MQNRKSMQEIVVCKSCGLASSGTYCFNCGQSLNMKRISLKSLLHEVTHFFTHMDKGIRYTLKELILRPGKMQRSYLEGNRVNHQKPFSMYFVSATVLGLILYWLNVLLMNYFQAGDASEASFFHQYMVVYLLLVIPFSTLITYVFFYSSGFNFSEIGVLQLYTLSIFFLIVIFCNLLKLIWPEFETRYLELPLVLLYNAVTFANFFSGNKWIVIIKSLFCAAILFLSIALVQDYLVEYYSSR